VLLSFGAKLKSEREKRAITLEQISASTKIGTRMLEALEQEKFNQLPGGIFNKGFVRAYARCLGLDEDQAVADYMEASGEAPVPRLEPGRLEAEAHGSPSEPGAAPSSRELPWALFAVLLLAVAVGLSIWSYRKRERHARPPAPPPVAAIQKSAPLASAIPSSASPPASGSGEPVAAASPNPAPDATTPATKKVPASSPLPPPDAAPAMAQLPGEFVVLIQAREDCWLLITADGEALPSELLSAGSQRAVHGTKQVVIRAGNAGGIDFFFNRKKLPPQGQSGEVKTITFGPHGLQSNVLAPPAAP
jgi:cytoskeleton protein RodZ